MLCHLSSAKRRAKVVGQHAPLFGAEFAQQLGHPPEQTPSVPAPPVEVAIWRSLVDSENDSLGIAIDRARRAGWPMASARMLWPIVGAAGSCARARGDTALAVEQHRGRDPVRSFGDGLFEILPQTAAAPRSVRRGA